MAKPTYALINGSWVLVGGTSIHSHLIDDVTGLQVELDAKANTSDVNTALSSKINLTEKGSVGGLATLDGSGVIPGSQIPSDIALDSELTAGLATKADASHSHLIADITDLPLVPDPVGVTIDHVWTADGTNSAAWQPIQYKKQTITAVVTGGLAPTIGLARFYNDTGSTWQIISVRAQVEEAPTGAAIVVDVNLSGTTIFTTQSNRPQISSGQSFGTKAIPDVTDVADGAYLTVDIDSVGTTTYGADLTIQIVVL